MTAFTWSWKRARLDAPSTSNAFCVDDDENSCDSAQLMEWRQRGSEAAESGDYSTALSMFHRVLCVDPGDAECHEMTAQLLMESDQHFRALLAAEMAVKLVPTWSAAAVTYARALFNFGELKAAIRSYQRALHLRPDDATVRQRDLPHCLRVYRTRNHGVEKAEGEYAMKFTDRNVVKLRE